MKIIQHNFANKGYSIFKNSQNLGKKYNYAETCPYRVISRPQRHDLYLWTDMLDHVKRNLSHFRVLLNPSRLHAFQCFLDGKFLRKTTKQAGNFADVCPGKGKQQKAQHEEVFPASVLENLHFLQTPSNVFFTFSSRMARNRGKVYFSVGLCIRLECRDR